MTSPPDPACWPDRAWPARAWSSRWSALARAAGILEGERLLLALSGGADSVFLLQLLAAAVPRPTVCAVHVNHGLRAEESERDARYCAGLCHALGVPYAERRIALGGQRGSLEARARSERYRVLAEEARRTGHRTILTGHHADDALETLLMRWIRGTSPHGLVGPRRRLELSSAAAGPAEGAPADPTGAAATVRVVRPLLGMRREEVRRLLKSQGLAWREDSSNHDPRFTRTRIRHGLLPLLERVVGPEGIDNLHAFGQAIERLEGELAAATAHLAWSPPPYRIASRGPLDSTLGGVLARAELMRVPPPLCRRALCRLVAEGTGRVPGPRLLDRLSRDVGAGRCTRHALPDGWTLLLRPRELHLLPPAARRALDRAERGGVLQPWLPFPEPSPASQRERAERVSQILAVPGQVRLADGRRIAAELVHAAPEAPVRGGPFEVELDAEGLPASLSVRWPRPGDRVRGLGAPGSKRLTRFLADRGIPREERRFVPLVSAGGEILWVTGVGPTESRRVGPATRHRLRLSLHHDCPPVDRAGWSGLSTERIERGAKETVLPFELGA